MRLVFDIGQIRLWCFLLLNHPLPKHERQNILAPMDDDRPCLQYYLHLSSEDIKFYFIEISMIFNYFIIDWTLARLGEK